MKTNISLTIIALSLSAFAGVPPGQKPLPMPVQPPTSQPGKSNPLPMPIRIFLFLIAR